MKERRVGDGERTVIGRETEGETEIETQEDRTSDGWTEWLDMLQIVFVCCQVLNACVVVWLCACAVVCGRVGV